MRAVAGIAVLAFAWWFFRNQASAAPLGNGASMKDQARAIIDQVNAEEFGGWFDPADVMAIIEVESSFDPNAYRYEAKLDDASIGLMQVLYRTALDRGLAGGPAALYDPALNIRIGMRQLKWSFDYLADRGGAPTTDQWIGSYNAGVGNALKGYVPLAYVAKWKAERARYGA